MVSNREHKKLSGVSRAVAGFVFAMVVIGSKGLVTALAGEVFDTFWLPVILIELLAGHISGSVLFTGYAPRYLLFTHGSLE